MKMELAVEQRDVVLAGAEDIFVAAAAGSGKTRVLVARFVAAVLGEIDLGGPCSVKDVLAVTFTDKAAGEIAERVRATLLSEGRGAEARQIEQAWVSTIHSMCSKVLRRYAFDAGLDPRFTVATQVEASILGQTAFEAAAKGLIETDPGVGRLVLDFGVSRVEVLVNAAYDALRSMGRSVADVRIGAAVDDSAIRQWALDFSGIADAYEGLGTSQTAQNGAESARLCGSALGQVPGAEDRPGAVIEALQVLGRGTFHARGSQEIKDLSAEAKDLLGVVGGALVQEVATPYELALLRLIDAFDQRYEAFKAEQGVLDFEDLQLKTALLLESHPEIATRYRDGFKLVMIDEFQDTNALQLRIARAVSHGDLLTVGDDKQSIYRFRHADVGVFRSLAEKTEVRILRSNYRSHPEVIAAINELFDSPTFFEGDFVRLLADRREDHEYAWSAEEPRVQFLFSEVRDARVDELRAKEAASIARRLAGLREAGVPQGDMVILLRAMKGRAEGIESALRGEGFDVYVASGGTYFDRPEVEEVTALLSVIDNPRNDAALMRVFAGRFAALDEATLYRLASGTPRGQHVWETIAELDALELPEAERAAVERVVSTIEQLRSNRGRRGIGELIHEACERLDYDLVLFASGPDGPRAWANVLKLGRMAQEYERRSAGDLSGFLEHVALHRDLAPETQATLTGEGLDAVRIMSIHAAKGLEFPVVVVADLASGGNNGCSDVLLGRDEAPILSVRLSKEVVPAGGPTESATFQELKAKEAAEEAAEADRLLYVACTRARECLILSAGVNAAKPAESTSDIDRLRRAAGLDAPAQELGEIVTLGEGASVVVRLEDVAPPETPATRPAAATWDGFPPVVSEPTPKDLPSLVPTAISYTALSVYGECAYKFYAKHVARLRTPRVPGDVGATEFGSAVHAALQLAGDGAVDPERLVAIGRANGLAQDQVDRLESAVTAYLGSTTALAVRGAERMHHECPFAVPLGETLLRGSLDLLAWRGSDATVVDYKTGRGELSPEAARSRYKAQAGCYALAVLRGGAHHVTVRFVEVERACRETLFEFTPDDADRIEAELDRTLSVIAKGEFQPLDAFSAEACTDCPALGGTCPINPRRGVAAGAVRTPR